MVLFVWCPECKMHHAYCFDKEETKVFNNNTLFKIKCEEKKFPCGRKINVDLKISSNKPLITGIEDPQKAVVLNL